MAIDVAVGTDKHIIRTSDRGLFRDCRQRWDFNSKIRLAYEPASSNPALEFGTAIHAGLEVYYDPDFWDIHYTERTEMAVARFLTVTAEQRRIFQRHFGEDFDKLVEYDARPELGEGMLRGYAEWANQKDAFKPLYVEIEFEVPVPDPILPQRQFQVDGLPVFYQGRIDMLVEDDEGYWIVDHKTAATFKEKEAYLMLDQQCGSYIWALQEQMGIKVEGVIYNELRKEIPHEPKVLKSGMLSVDRRQLTTAELFGKKAAELGQDPEHYGEYFNWLKEQPNKYFRRQPVTRSQAELKQLGNNISREAWDMLTSPYIYPNPGEYKCQGCAFRAPCLARQAGQDYDEMLQDTHLYRRIA